MTPDRAPIQPDYKRTDIDSLNESTPIFDQLFLEWGSNPFGPLPVLNVVEATDGTAKSTSEIRENSTTVTPDFLATEGLAKVIAAQVAGNYRNPKYGVRPGLAA